MQFVLTAAGQSAIALNPAVPPVLSMYKLGDAYGYIPAPTDLDIHGTQVWSGAPSSPVAQSNNVIKYTVHLDATLGDFNFGEVGLFLPGGVLFAIGVASFPITKLKYLGTQIGNNLVIDAYVTTAGTNYAIYAELGNSGTPINLSALPGVDTLPAAHVSFPNIYVIGAPDDSGSILAYSNNSFWSFSGYEEVADVQVVAAATPVSITCGGPSVPPAYAGELILQVIDGPAMGVCRIITGYTSAGYIFSVATPFNQVPETNNTVRILKKTQLRPNVAALLAGLEIGLTPGHLNDLLDYPLDSMVKKDGSVAMLAPFNAGTHRIVNVGGPLLPTDGANKDYVDQQLTVSASLLAALSAAVTDMQNKYFRKDGALPMSGHLNFGGNRGVNMATPVNPSDGATKAFVESTVATALATLVTVHNDLSGLQGGNGSSEYHHLTAAERTWVTNLMTNGLPVATYATTGVTQLADTNVVGAGTSATTAVTPESLYLALTNATTNPLQNAVIGIVNTSSVIQAGSGNPTALTASHPEIYLDVSVNPPVPWVRYAGTWREITAKVAQFGLGAPTASTSVVPVLYFDTTVSSNWAPYVYSGGAWHPMFTSYVQYGVGAPTAGTAVTPTMYVDTSTSPYSTYTYYGGAWHLTGTNSITEVDLFFFGQI